MITISNIRKGTVKAAKPLFTFSFLLFTLASNAQDLSLKSKVISTDKTPVEGAIITIKGGSSVVTDKEGIFELNAKSQNGIVTIKAPGFYDTEMPLKYFYNMSKKGLNNITLTPKAEKQYNGYVTTSAAETRLNGDKMASTAGMELKDFGEQLGVGAAIGNNVAGLQTIEKSGMPNEGSYMNIRGIHTLTAENNPLIVINGVPYFGNLNASQIIQGYSRDILAGYDPKDIRSITVLKGSEAAEWGSLGSNGVILIETQQANSDNLDTKITFSGQYGFTMAKNNISMLGASDYQNYARDLGLTLYPSLSSLTTDYPFLQNTSDYTGNYLFNENNNWMDQIQHMGFSTDNQLRVEGGDEIAKYNISFGYTRTGGTLKNTGTDRYHTLISADVLVTRAIDIFANVSLSYIKSSLLNTGTTSSYNPILSAMWNSPMISAYKKQSDGQTLPNLAAYNEWNTSSNPMYSYDNVSNPLAIVENVQGTDKTYDANAQLGINGRVNNYLTLQGLVNIYYNYTEENMFVPGVTDQTIVPQYYGKGENYSAGGVVRQLTNTYQASATYNRTFNKVHELNARFAARFLNHKLEIDGLSGYNTPNDYFTSLNNLQDGIQTLGSNYYWNYLGFGLSADYVWNKLIRVNGGVHFDMTSASGADASRLAAFPSLGVTFMLANTGWLPEAIDKLNISVEASYTGNSRFSSNYSKNYYSGTAGTIGGITRENMPNTKLSWEKTRQMDFGFEISTLKGRASFGFNYYIAHAYDLLVTSNVSSVYGSANYYDNLGQINNQGVEASLRLNPVHNKDWDFVIGATIAHAKSRLVSLGGSTSKNVISFTSYGNDDAQVVMQVGMNPYEFYGYETRGVYATAAEAQKANLTNAAGQHYQAGDIRFVDQNGDGVINSEDKTTIGCATPDVFGALNLGLRYKRFTLDANFGYSIGNDAYNYTRRQVESMSTFYNQSTAVLNRWQVEGQITEMPRATYDDAIGNSVFSDRWIENASYFKLRSVKLSYSFDRFLKFINSGDVWVAGENLFTVTNYLGADPEFSYSYSECMRGFDYAKQALGRTIKVGFDLNF